MVNKPILIFILVLVDQITKVFFKNKSFLVFNYTTNAGAAFSLFQNQNLFLIITSIMILVFLIYLYKKYPRLQVYLSLVIAGTIGNLIDRIFFGYVRDFIDLRVWPVFNIADSLSVIGVLLIAYSLIKNEDKS